MKIEPQILWLAVATVATVLIFWLGHRWGPEGFQGRRASAGQGTLFPVAPFVPRKDASHGPTFKGVPLVIYHSWGTAAVPPRMYDNIQSIINQNPEFDYSFNTDDDCRRFIAEHFETDVVKAFDCLRPGAYKSDLWRYCVLYKNGGVYMDIKCRPKKKIIDIMTMYDLPLFVKDSPTDFPYPCLWNGFMISAPGNIVFKKCIDEVVKNVAQQSYEGGSLNITGPCLLGRVMDTFPGVKIYKLRDAHYKTVDDSGTIILEQYPEYRREQKMYQKGGKHYGELYRRGEVYSC